MRGKLYDRRYVGFYKRITPACAGKTTPRALHRRRKEDHPRVCGENQEINGVTYVAQGSPPRVRGKPVDLCSDEVLIGITPACAGKTLSRR